MPVDWAFVLAAASPLAVVIAVVVIFIWGLRGVSERNKPEVIRAMAELVRAFRHGGTDNRTEGGT